MSQWRLFPVVFALNDFRSFSKNRSFRGKGNICRSIILNEKKGRGPTGTVMETEEIVEEHHNLADFIVFLRPRQRVPE